MSKAEVTWGMLGDWADHLGVADEEEANDALVRARLAELAIDHTRKAKSHR